MGSEQQWGWTEEVSRVALGQAPPECVVRAGAVFDAVTGRFLTGRALLLKSGRICRVVAADEPLPAGVEVIDCSELTLVPGLIDGHTHLVRLFVPEFVRALLPTGVTSAVVETMEFGQVVGLPGIRLVVGALRDQPLRLFFTVPALCGLTEDEERQAPDPAALDDLLRSSDCLGLGEVYWSNALLPGRQGRRLRQLIERTLAAGKVVEGHTAGARGARLDAYQALGASSCHEPINLQEALELYERGFLVMIREGGIRRDLRALLPLFERPLDFRRFALVTDSVEPGRLASWGYLDQVVREALEMGLDPAVVYRMASTNLAEHFRLEHELGYLAPGRRADLVAIPSPAEFRPEMVMVGGRVVARAGQALAQPRPVPVPAELLRTVRPEVSRGLARAGGLPVRPPTAPVRVIEYVTSLVTRETVLTPGEAAHADLTPVLAVERTAAQQAFVGFVLGYGLQEGAFGTSISWDSPDLVVLGGDERSITTVLARLAELGGGAVLARGSEVLAELDGSVVGVASQAAVPEVAAAQERLVAGLRALGARLDDPLLAVETLTTPAIPHLRITHRGYVRLKDRALLPLLA